MHSLIISATFGTTPVYHFYLPAKVKFDWKNLKARSRLKVLLFDYPS